MNRAYRIASLRILVANDRQRVAWLGVMLDEFPDDCLPDNFHAQCVLARQMLRSREEELADLLSPTAHPCASCAFSAAQAASEKHGDSLPTSGQAALPVTF